MVRDTYSTYEAKASFSELLRKVRGGRIITITYHGEPVAELRPLERSAGTEARIERLAARGQITDRPERRELAVVTRRPGALRRFLEERDEP